MRSEQGWSPHECKRWTLAAAACLAGAGFGVVLAMVSVAAHAGETSPDSSALVPIAVFGTDDRTPVPDRYAAVQESLGVLLNARARTACTAFCVGPSIVATAGHCLFRADRGQKPRLAEFWFARNYDRVRDYARIAGHAQGLARASVVAGATALRLTPPIDAVSDWALVRLDRPVCAGRTLQAAALSADAMEQAARDGRFFQIAYHRDYRLWRQAYSMPCTLARSFPAADRATIEADFSNAGGLLLHTCDTGGASSGSPLLIDTADGVRVAGINVGTYVLTRTTTTAGGGSPIRSQETVANTGVAAAVFMQRLGAMASMRPLTDARALRELDRLLGRGRAPITDDDRQAAIEAYEAASGGPVTGLAGEALLARLRTAPPRP